MLLIEIYCGSLRLGVVNAMAREYPYLLGQGDEQAADSVVQTAQTYTAGVIVVMTIGLLTVGAAEPATNWRLAYWALIPVVGGNLARTFLEAMFRGGKNFQRLAIVNAITIVLAPLTLWVVREAGYLGFLVRAALLTVIPAILCWYWRPVRVPFRAGLAGIQMLVKEGMPLWVNNYFTGLQQNLPRIAISWFGGPAVLGLYAPVASLINLGQQIPGALSPYLLPHLNFEYGRGAREEEVIRVSSKAAVAAMAALMPAAVVGWYTLPSVVESWLPAYRESITAMKWSCIVIATGGLRLYTIPFTVLKAWAPMLWTTLASLGTLLLLLCAGLVWGRESPLEAVVWGQIAAAPALWLITSLGLKRARRVKCTT